MAMDSKGEVTERTPDCRSASHVLDRGVGGQRQRVGHPGNGSMLSKKIQSQLSETNTNFKSNLKKAELILYLGNNKTKYNSFVVQRSRLKGSMGWKNEQDYRLHGRSHEWEFFLPAPWDQEIME